MKFIGLDISKRSIQLCILDSRGKVVKELSVANNDRDLYEQLGRLRGPLSVCYEASCGYGHLYDRLSTIAKHVCVAHPGHLRLIFKSKRKNDRVDAKKLATLLLLDQVPAVYVPSMNIRGWRRMIEFRNRLVRERTRLKNRLRALCRSHAIALPANKRVWTKKGLQMLADLSFDHPSATLERDISISELKHNAEQTRRIEKELNRIADDHPAVILLRSIPGVGPRTAEAVAAFIDRPQRFRKSKHIAAYFGLVPSQDQSGNVNRLGHITREGPSVVRRLLTEAAWQGIRHSPRIRAYFERVRRDDPARRKIALVATAHYLVRVMLALLKRNEMWNEAGGPTSASAAAAESRVTVNDGRHGRARSIEVGSETDEPRSGGIVRSYQRP